MSSTITIDTDSYDSIRAALESGITTIEQIAEYRDGIGEYAEIVEGCLVIEPGYRADDGNGEVHYEDADCGEGAADEYVSGGDWGAEGGSVEVMTWRDAIAPDGRVVQVEEESHSVDIPIDHEGAIEAVMGRHAGCGLSPDDHDWTSEGEGGCLENPGVWSVGGTAMVFRSRCSRCGLIREEYHAGSQRNPGEASESVTYTAPEEDCDAQ